MDHFANTLFSQLREYYYHPSFHHNLFWNCNFHKDNYLRLLNHNQPI